MFDIHHWRNVDLKVVLLESKCMLTPKVDMSAKARYLAAASTFGVNLHLFNST